MISTSFKIIPKSFLGIDIGTSSVKITELSKWGERIKLENYGEMSALTLYEKPFRTFGKSTLTLSSQDIAKAILAIITEAKIKEKKSFFSIPDFSTFFTTFDLPSMTKEEIPMAVKYQARQYVPLSLSTVTLDWQIIEGKANNKEKKPLKVLTVAVPNEIINQYQEIASLSNLQLQALEAEVFGLARVLTGEDKRVISIVDIGAQSTTCSIVEKKNLKMSHSFDIAGNELTHTLAKSLNIDYKEAEGLKRKYGLVGSAKENKVTQVLNSLIDMILIEIEKIFNNFYQTERKKVQKLILAGGTALLPGLKEYFFEKLKIETEVANPFSEIFCPPILNKNLKEMGPGYAISVGAALRGFE